jgi:hypothetical protein
VYIGFYSRRVVERMSVDLYGYHVDLFAAPHYLKEQNRSRGMRVDDQIEGKK